MNKHIVKHIVIHGTKKHIGTKSGLMNKHIVKHIGTYQVPVEVQTYRETYRSPD
jgi:hypothetical protein